MTLQELLAETVLSAMNALERFLPGFNDQNRTAQAKDLPNHLIWSLGHVSVYLNDVAGKLDGRQMPESDFGPDVGGAPGRFALPAVGFGSEPVTDRSAYPMLARGVEIFESSCRRLAEAARQASSAALEQKVDWLGKQIPLAQRVTGVVLHVGMHTGQILDLRRALGLGSVIKH